MSFLVTGLPRSRTAWWSVVLDCPHEPSAWCASFEAWADVLRTQGASDSAVAFQLPRIMLKLNPRTLIVERPLMDVARSAAGLFDCAPSDLLLGLSNVLSALQFEHANIRRISYADLSDAKKLIEAAEWLKPGSGARAVKLMHFRIEVEKSRAMRMLHADHSGWHLEPA